MILGSQAKLENDNRGLNVKRGQKTRAEMGYRPCMAPLGYLHERPAGGSRSRVVVDPERAPIVKQMFEKVAYEQWSGRKVYNWLRFDLNFHTRGNRPLTLSGVYRMLQMPIYYGPFEYPRNSGQWYQGTHEALITEELFKKVQEQLKRDKIVRENREFAFTKLFTCGMCGSGITAQEKYKLLKDGTNAKYVYYSCSKARDRNCKNKYIREEELVEELFKIIDKLNMNELGMRMKLEEEIKRFNRLQRLATKGKPKMQIDEDDIATREYAKYVLREGTAIEKRELMGHLRSRLVLNDKKITLVEE
jgi:predicted metal-binding protein